MIWHPDVAQYRTVVTHFCKIQHLWPKRETPPFVNKQVRNALLKVSWKWPKSKIIMRLSFFFGWDWPFPHAANKESDLCWSHILIKFGKDRARETWGAKGQGGFYSSWHSNFLSKYIRLALPAPSSYRSSDTRRRYPNPDQPLFLPLLLGKGINWWDNQTLFTLLKPTQKRLRPTPPW